MLARLTPMPLAVAREPFDLEWIYEVKWDGFRALAYIEGHHCKLVSRKGREYNSRFYNLMFRREWPHFMAFDLLWLDGADLRQLPLHHVGAGSHASCLAFRHAFGWSNRFRDAVSILQRRVSTRPRRHRREVGERYVPDDQQNVVVEDPQSAVFTVGGTA